MVRKRGSRFRKAIDAQEPYEQIEARQRKLRKRKRGAAVNRITKSEQRETTWRKRIGNLDDVYAEYELKQDS